MLTTCREDSSFSSLQAANLTQPRSPPLSSSHSTPDHQIRQVCSDIYVVLIKSYLCQHILNCRYDLLVDLEDVTNVLLRVLVVGHHVVGGVLGRLEHVSLLGEQEAIELA